MNRRIWCIKEKYFISKYAHNY